MRILVLVLMSGGYPYDQFRDIWRTYNKSHPTIDCYFYRCSPVLPTEYVLDKDTLWIRMKESYETLFEKTLRAFRYFINTRPNTYTFLFRTNASSLMNFTKYYELCQTFPTENFCSATTGQNSGITFPSGCGYTLSMDLVERFAREPGLKPVVMDDVSIGYFLQKWNIPITPSSKYTFVLRDYSPEETGWIVSTYFHFRFRNDSNRRWDIQSMKTIADTIYGKK